MHHSPPFGNLFHEFGSPPSHHVGSINQSAIEDMLRLLSRPLSSPGYCTLLSSPRAGYGKTHLLSMVRNQLASTHVFVLLHPADGFRIDAESSLADVLVHLTRVLPAGGGLTSLDLLARRIFANGLEPLIRSGELPCQDRDQALHSFIYRPVETFDFHHPAAATAHWVRKNFEILRTRIAEEVAGIIMAPLPFVSFWIDALFHYAVTPIDEMTRSSGLLADVSKAANPTSVIELLATLLKLLTQTHRVVLVADELEVFSTNEDAALRLVSFLTALRSNVGRLDVILSVNDDVWENAFMPKITGGLLDRISEYSVRLEPLDRDQAIALVGARYESAVEWIDQIRADQVLYARVLLKHAAVFWAKFGTGMQSSYALANAPTGGSVIPFTVVQSEQIGEVVTEVDRPEKSADAYDSTTDTFVDEIATENGVLEHKVTAENELSSAPVLSATPAVEDTPAFIQTADLNSSSAVFSGLPSATASEDFSRVESIVDTDNVVKAAEDFRGLSFSDEQMSSVKGENARVDDLLRQFRERYRETMHE